MSKVYTGGAPTVRKRGGRAEARGAQARIQAADMHERLIRNIENPRRQYSNRAPTKSELMQMIAQAAEAAQNFPDSMPAQLRLKQLVGAYKQLYGNR